jgi:hypothetical protein
MARVTAYISLLHNHQVYDQLQRGDPTCGWRCAYTSIRAATVYRHEYADAALQFLEQERGKYMQQAVTGGGDAGRMIAVHWRRGDFLVQGRGRVRLDTA